jgi:hypothetical protein
MSEFSEAHSGTFGGRLKPLKSFEIFRSPVPVGAVLRQIGGKYQLDLNF